MRKTRPRQPRDFLRFNVYQQVTAQFQNTRDSERSAAVSNSRPFADDNADGSLLQDNEFEQNFVRREIRHAQMDEMLTSFSNTQTQIVITQFNFHINIHFRC